MSQRCAKSWDNMCNVYLSSSNVDQGGFLHPNKQFLTEAAKKKYCHMSSAPGTHCAEHCQAFVPEGQSSVQVCDTWGTYNWLDTREEYDLGGNFPQSSRLNPISPLYMSYCPDVCDATNPMPADALGPNDPVLNYCLQHGTCTQVLQDLAFNLVANNQESRVTNPAFQKIIQLAKIDQPINPNVVAKIATSYGLPIDVAVDVLRGAKQGGISGEVSPQVFDIVQPPGSGRVEIAGSSPVVSSTMVSMPPPPHGAATRTTPVPMALKQLMNAPASGHKPSTHVRGVVSPTTKPRGVVSPTKGKKPQFKRPRGREGFYRQSINGRVIVGGLVGVAVLALLIWFLMSKR